MALHRLMFSSYRSVGLSHLNVSSSPLITLTSCRHVKSGSDRTTCPPSSSSGVKFSTSINPSPSAATSDVTIDANGPMTPSEGLIHNGEMVSWKEQEPLTPSTLSTYYLRLSKFRLTSLVVCTTLAGYSMAPGSLSLPPSMLVAALAGTALTSASAAALNQFLEVPFDSQMQRTKTRPLVMHQVTPLHSFNFSLVTGIGGLSLLAFGVNPLTGLLGAINLVLYSFIYTPMKRGNIVNTWIGSLVGAIPPLMGYTAVTGFIDCPGLILSAILYSWQFPHFNALSWNIRHDYARAGYRMMSVTDPDLCLRTQLRHSILLTSYCILMSTPLIGLTTWTFAVDSLPFNLYLMYLSYKFKSEPSASSSRKLFRYSLVHLPAIILLMIISKNVDNNPQVDKSMSQQIETNNNVNEI